MQNRPIMEQTSVPSSEPSAATVDILFRTNILDGEAGTSTGNGNGNDEQLSCSSGTLGAACVSMPK